MEKIRFGLMCAKLNMKILYGGESDVLLFKQSAIINSGLALTGFLTQAKGSAVLIGEQDGAYLLSLNEEEKERALCNIKEAELIVLTAPQIRKDLLKFAEKYKVKACFCDKPDSCAYDLSVYIEGKLNSVEIIHGVLMDVFGVGVLIVGDSGVGKSETALELIGRGHLLIADDAVAVRREGYVLIGCSPSITRHLMDIRGIGIIDIRAMYGAGAIKNDQEIDLVIRLETFDEDKDYRGEEWFSLSGVSVSMLTMPLYHGRNAAVLTEVAARNFKLQAMGFSAENELRLRMQKENKKTDD